MKFTWIELEGTPDELKQLPVGNALFDRLSDRAARVPDSDFDPDADDAAAEMADAEASAGPAPSGPGTIAGVAADGQAAVRAQLDENPASDLFEQFLAETSSWPSVKVVGVKIRRSPVGAPLDFTRYLRIRKE